MNKKKIIAIFLSVLFIGGSFSVIAQFQHNTESSNLFYLIQLPYSKDTLSFLQKNHFDIINKKNNQIDAIVSKTDLGLLDSNNIGYSLQINDVGSLFDKSRGEYHTYPEMVAILEDIANNYPDITNLYSIGESWEGREIWCLEITDNPGTNEDEPGVFFMGLHHAREWPTVEICLHIADELTSEYNNDPDITNIVNNRRIWIVPCENPDGYVYSHDQGHSMWRKNRRYLPEFGTYGIDPNRNYGGSCNGDPWGSWGSIGIGSQSHYSNDDTYCGPWSMSENCTQSIKNMYMEHDICASISWHTYGELVMWPWGYSQSDNTPDDTYISQVGTDIANVITQQDGTGQYTPQQSSSLYPTTGDTSDWAYGYHYYDKGYPHFAYTIEACTSFFPSEGYLDQVCEENFDGAFYLLQEAENINNVIPQVIPPVIDDMSEDLDGDYTVSWTEQNPNANPDFFQLDELSELTLQVEDAESGSTLWNLDGFSRSTSRSHSGSYSYKSRYSNEDVSAMTTVFPLPVSNGMKLSFYCWYDIETNYDMAFVEVSTDGRTYTLLDTFTGSSNGWIYKEYSLDEWTDESVYIRFRYTTDSYTQDEGFYVDDITPIAYFDLVTTLSNSITTNSYTILGKNPGIYYYMVKGHNTNRGWGDFSTLEGINVTENNEVITISDVSANPRLQEQPGWVNITCEYSSMNPIQHLMINITMPDNSYLNQSMHLINSTLCYYNTSYSLIGTYSYDIWIKDTQDNGLKSSNYFFYIGENYKTIPLQTGWNLITVPVETSWWASDLADNVTDCGSVSGWNADDQTYNTYIVGVPESDFVIEDGCGYFVDVNEDSMLSVNGNPISSVNVSLKIGWNLLGWYHDYNTTASSFAENISGCGSVSSWDATSQTYNTHIVGVPESDYTISQGMGMFVDVTEESYWHGEG